MGRKTIFGKFVGFRSAVYNPKLQQQANTS